jgi:hypothetical protein
MQPFRSCVRVEWQQTIARLARQFIALRHSFSNFIKSHEVIVRATSEIAVIDNTRNNDNQGRFIGVCAIMNRILIAAMIKDPTAKNTEVFFMFLTVNSSHRAVNGSSF